MTSASPGGLEISVERRDARTGQVAVVRAEGEVDLATAEELATALRTNSGAETDFLVLDLVAVPFMDSSGLRVVLVASDELEHGLVVVTSPGSPVLRLFELAEVSDRIRTFTTEDEAIEAIAGESQRGA